MGPIPDMVLPTTDCLNLVVAVEAEPYKDARHAVQDPLGAVTIIKFQDLSTGKYTIKELNFHQFDNRYG